MKCLLPAHDLRRILTILVSFLSALSTRAESIYDTRVRTIDREETTLAEYQGEVLLIVNVASKCGNTPQYEQLEAAYKKYHEEGFTILGFPCNQFGHQEPGSNEEIVEFCKLNYGVTFPLFDKIEVNGSERHPLYTWLAGPDSRFPGDIRWNFAKFLVGRDGTILARFAPSKKVDTPEAVAAIEAALAAKPKN